MLIEAVTTIAAAGLAGYSYLQVRGGSPTSDTDKIQKIFTNAGWQGRGGETIRLQRKRKIEGGTEYVYQLPLGFDRKKIEDHIHIIEDGLNVRSNVLDFELSGLKELKFDKTIVQQIQSLLKSKRKQKDIEIEFDGMLKIRVFNETMPKEIKWNETLLNLGTWSVPIGKTRKELIYHDFDKAKHLIISGSTGYGKSVILKLIVTTLLTQQPENVELTLIDLKGGSAFHRFKDCWQVRYFEREPDKAVEVLKQTQKEMNKSFVDVVDKGFEDVKEAGIKKRHFIVIDEAADLADNKKATEIITDIARRGRSAGYYLVFCTQYPTAEVIPSQTKRNIISRLCYLVDTDIASRVVLDEGGASELPDIPGRGIYKCGPKRYILQSPIISNSKIKELITPYIVKKEGNDEQKERGQTTKNRKYTLVIEEDGLSD